MTMQMFDEPVLNESEERELAAAIEAGVVAAEVLRLRRRRIAPAYADHGSKLTPYSQLSAELAPGASDNDLRELEQAGELAFTRFVRANLRLVAMVTVKTALRAGLELDDLFQEGVLGLVEAARRFDHRRNVRFATFALPWIKMRVADSAVTRAGEVDLPVSRARAWVQARTTQDHLAQRLSREPTCAEIAHAVGRPERVVKALLAYVPSERVADTSGFAYQVTPPAPTSPDDHALHDCLRLLEPEQKATIDLLYGLTGEGVMTYVDVAATLNVSISTVRRRERAALDRLRSQPILLAA